MESRQCVGMQDRLPNKKSHLGLEQISVLAASGRTFLGSKRCYKFIVDDTTGETAVICSAFRLLENLQLDCPVGQLLNEAVQAQYKQYKSGTTTLLCLAGSWSKAVLNCIRQDIPIPVIVSVMYEALEHCFEVLKSYQISIDSILKVSCCQQKPQTSKSCTLCKSSICLDEMYSVVKGPTQTTTSIQGNSTKNNVNASSLGCFSSRITAYASSDQCRESSMHKELKSKVKMSRYFTTPESKKQEETLLTSSSSFQMDSFLSTPDYARFTALALSLSHGNEQMMQLAVEAYKIQTQHLVTENACRTFPELDVEKLVTYFFPGLPECHSCVSAGLIALVSVEQSIIVECLAGLPLHTILINGDLTETYHHPGFNRISNITVVKQTVIVKSLDEEWLDIAIDTLNKFHINLILVKGITSPHLMDRCLQENILIIQKVKDSVIQSFAEAMGAITVSYITQVNEHCVGTGAHLGFWKAKNAPNLEDKIAVQINTFKTSVLSVVLCSPLSCKLQTMEDQFWTCVYRLNHALRERQIFPGAGATELLCLQHLKQLILEAKIFKPGTDEQCSSWFADTIFYRSQVLQSLADGLVEYLVTALFNTGMYVTSLDALAEVQKCLHSGIGLFPIISEVSRKHVNLGIPSMSDSTSLNEDSFEYKVHDNVIIKLEAWRRALNLVLLTLQADAEIITGRESKTSAADRKIDFLNSFISV
ncbi:Bardet-Biedl syndrome 12 protein isoform X1 [Hemitrygon akajei]|uniref:Bardet-Biedl syndrome 12 protein isoform X1 n=2 Tax=Hemitrygon akajei TaxID=2704970 RepID=UPI003BF99676